MAVIEALAHEPHVRGRQLYVRAPRPIDFPSEEEVPETKRHLETRTTLYLLLKEAFAGTAIGSEQFVYWDAGDPQRCLSPDVFVKTGSSALVFDTWKIWERGAPDLAVEIVSASDRRDADWAEKLERYQASGIRELVRFDAEAEPTTLRMWDRIDGELVERAASSPSLYECATLRLWWVTLPSEYGLMLRLANDRAGKSLLPTPSEERLRLAEELADERRARSLAEHERTLAQHARTLAEQKLQAEVEARSSAETARGAAETARGAAEAAREAAEADNERLRSELARLRAGR